MANVIKHKRGSGSDPAANNLVLGELAIRTDVGKLFTKMDSGAIAEIAGGGSDIAINTLSSSSATGGGSATFNGSAYRFTLSAPPSVSAQQLLVSINGVIQKPVAGTGQPSEGFSVDGTDIILGDAPATGADFFILTFKSLGVSEPADNSVTSAKIVDGAIVNADINASAAIAGTKISPDFGSQAITTTGTAATGALNVTGAITADDLRTDNSQTFFLTTANDFRFRSTGGSERMRIDSSGRLLVGSASTANNGRIQGFIAHGSTAGESGITSVDTNSMASGVGGEISFYGKTSSSGYNYLGHIRGIKENGTDTNTACALTFHTRPTLTAPLERMRIDSSGNVGIGTTNPSSKLHVANDNSFAAKFGGSGGGSDYFIEIGQLGTNSSAGFNATGTSGSMLFKIGGSEKMRIAHTTGNVGIGVTTVQERLHVANAGNCNITSQCTASGSGANAAVQVKSADGGDYLIQTGNAVSGGLRVYDGGASAERMRITSSGILKVGATTITDIYNTSGTGNEGAWLVAGGASQFAASNTEIMRLNRKTSNGKILLFYYNGSEVGSISTNANSLPSDRDFKTNIADLTLGLSFVNKLKPSQFNYKIDEPNTPVMYGLIAQELEESLTSEGVTKNSTQLLQHHPTEDTESDYDVDYTKLVPILINSIKELAAKVEALEAK